jgi:hypothetical protein
VVTHPHAFLHVVVPRANFALLDRHSHLTSAKKIFQPRFFSGWTIPQQDSAERAFNKLARTFAAQVETLKRRRLLAAGILSARKWSLQPAD